MIDLDWETVKEFYKEKFGIDGWVVEMYANLDILTLCASGACNETISNFLEIPVKDIKEVIHETFDFYGWDRDLPVNPYKILCNCYNEYGEFSKHASTRFISDMYSGIRDVQGMINREFIIGKSYWISSTLYDIERKIQDEWI